MLAKRSPDKSTELLHTFIRFNKQHVKMELSSVFPILDMFVNFSMQSTHRTALIFEDDIAAPDANVVADMTNDG